MSEEIPISVVDAAWEEASAIPLARIPMEMEKAGRAQPELLAFILGSTEGMTAGVGELAGFIYFVIWRVFRAETRSGVRPKHMPITGAVIQRALEANEEALMGFDGVDPQSVGSDAIARLTRQPALLSYVIESIAEAEEDENDPVTMTPEEKGAVILLLKTAIDVLNDARTGTGPA